MNIFAISSLVNVVTSITLGFLVLFTKPKDRTNQTFFLFAFSVAVWGYYYFIWQIAQDSASALLWVHWLMAGAIFIPFFYFHFIARFLGLEHELRWGLWFGYGSALFFSIVNWTGGFINNVAVESGFRFWPFAGPFFSSFLVVWVLYALYPVVLLIRRSRQATGLELSQIRYILIGTVIGYMGGCTNYFLWYGIPVLPYGNITASIYIIFVAYAILKHGLFSMKVAATEFIVFALWLFVFIRMLLANSTAEQFIDGGLLSVLLVVGVLLIRSVNQEVEERKKVERLADELKRTNERQEVLIHFIGHEVKGFLTKDAGVFASLAEGDFCSLPDMAKPLVERALIESRKGADSVASILKAANLKKGTVTYVKEPFDMKALVAESVERARMAAEQKGLALSFAADGDGYEYVGDKTELGEHVLRNLIDNAISYTPSGSIAVTLEKARDESLGKDTLTLRVRDTGIGITDEDKKALFTEGGHGRDSVRVNVHSTGYGLYIAKSIVEAHGGTIRAESEGAGKGSTFIVELPV